MTFVLGQPSALLCAVGFILGFVSFIGLGTVVGRSEDPLRSAGVTGRQRADIRGMILRRSLSTDPGLRHLAFSWADYETRTGRTILRWHPPLAAGIILALCGLYAFPVISTIVVVVQVLLLLVRTILFVADRRRVRNSVDLLRDGGFDTTGIAADFSE